MKIILVILLSGFLNTVYCKTWGLGAVIGSPTGFSVNRFLTEHKTVHSTLAWDFNGRDELQFASHYTWRRTNDIHFQNFDLDWFFGAGGKIWFLNSKHHDDDYAIGPSGTAGLYHLVKNTPLEVFVKSNLTIHLIEKTDADLDVMLGAHYNF